MGVAGSGQVPNTPRKGIKITRVSMAPINVPGWFAPSVVPAEVAVFYRIVNKSFWPEEISYR